MTTAAEQLAAHHHQLTALLEQTAHCEHFADGRYPLPGCAWCDLFDRLDEAENAMALEAGRQMPNRRGKS